MTTQVFLQLQTKLNSHSDFLQWPQKPSPSYLMSLKKTKEPVERDRDEKRLKNRVSQSWNSNLNTHCITQWCNTQKSYLNLNIFESFLAR